MPNRKYHSSCIKRFVFVNEVPVIWQNFYIPIHDYEKKPYFTWNSYKPTYDTFLRYANSNKHKLTGIAVLSEFIGDYVCIDIDHHISGQDIIDLVSDVIDRVAIEYTPSNGVHIWFKMTPEDCEYCRKQYVVSRQYIANGVEFITRFDKRLILTYPSIAKNKQGEIKQYLPVFGNLNSVGYLKRQEVENLFQKLIAKYGTYKSPIISVPKHIRPILDEVHEQMKGDVNLIFEILRFFELEPEDVPYGYRIHSLYGDYGNERSGMVFIDSAWYVDHHLSAGNKLIYCLYDAFPDKTVELLQKIGKQVTLHPYAKIPNVEFKNAVNECDILVENRRELLIAPCGYGKTTLVKNKAIQGEKIILLGPYVDQIKQIAKQYVRDKEKQKPFGKIKASFWYYKSPYKQIDDDTTFIVATYDQFGKILVELGERINEFKIVIDEAHELILALNYRMDTLLFLWTFLQEREQYTLLTATSYFLNLHKFVDHVYVVLPRKRQYRYLDVIKGGLKQLTTNVILAYRQYNPKQIVIHDNKRHLEQIRQMLISYGIPESDIALITSEDKEDAEPITSTCQLHKPITLATRALSTGIDIIEDGQFVVHVIPSDINVLIQALSRIREYNANKVFALIYVSKPNKLTLEQLEERYNDIELQLIERRHSVNAIKKYIQYIQDNHITDKQYYGKYHLFVLAQYCDFAINKIAYDVITPLVVRSISLIKQLATVEGWTIRKLQIVDSKQQQAEMKSQHQNIDYSSIFGDIMQNYESVKVHELSTVEYKVYELVKKIKQYPEIYDNEQFLEEIRTLLKEGKLRQAKQKASHMFNKWIIRNIEKVDLDTSAQISYECLEFVEKVLRFLQNNNRDYITTGELKTIEQELSKPIAKYMKKAILESLGLKYRKNKNKWIVQKPIDYSFWQNLVIRIRGTYIE